MQRDGSIIFALAALIGYAIVCKLAGAKSDTASAGPQWWFHLFTFIYFLGLLRCIVLWVQTLHHAAKPPTKESPKLVWIIAHVLFGPIASFAYYFSHPEPEDTPSNTRR